MLSKVPSLIQRIQSVSFVMTSFLSYTSCQMPRPQAFMPHVCLSVCIRTSWGMWGHIYASKYSILTETFWILAGTNRFLVSCPSTSTPILAGTNWFLVGSPSISTPVLVGTNRFLVGCPSTSTPILEVLSEIMPRPFPTTFTVAVTQCCPVSNNYGDAKWTTDKKACIQRQHFQNH